MTEVVVLGAGVIGLATALSLAQAGVPSTVWARALSTRTSSVAAAFWYPFRCQPAQLVRDWSAETYRWLSAHPATDAHSGVRPVPEYVRSDGPEDSLWREVNATSEPLPDAQIPAGYPAGYRRGSLVMDTTLFLPWLTDQLARHGVPVVTRAVRSLREATREAAVVVNSTGLGAAELCADNRRQAIRGQVLRFPLPATPRGIIDASGPTYVIPRETDVVVGGTVGPADDRDLNPRPADTRAILERAMAIGAHFDAGDVIETVVGLRPGRTEVRLIRDSADSAVVHNYGHGGAGYTVCWGCAQKACALVVLALFEYHRG